MKTKSLINNQINPYKIRKDIETNGSTELNDGNKHKLIDCIRASTLEDFLRKELQFLWIIIGYLGLMLYAGTHGEEAVRSNPSGYINLALIAIVFHAILSSMRHMAAYSIKRDRVNKNQFKYIKAIINMDRNNKYVHASVCCKPNTECIAVALNGSVPGVEKIYCIESLEEQ